MNENEWLTCQEPQTMLDFLRTSGKMSERKARLFAVACCYRVWHLLHDERSRKAVEVAERYADGFETEETLSEAEEEADEAAWQAECALSDAAMEVVRSSPLGSPVPKDDPSLVGARAASSAVVAAVAAPVREGQTAQDTAYALKTEKVFDRIEQANLLRDIFGDPFCPQQLMIASWLTPIVLKLTQNIYEQRSFCQLPDLAQTLADAGCTDVGLLAHLRSPGPHVRGCFALDALLGKL